MKTAEEWINEFGCRQHKIGTDNVSMIRLERYFKQIQADALRHAADKCEYVLGFYSIASSVLDAEADKLETK